jgi:excisionase family DNA binding protein
MIETSARPNSLLSVPDVAKRLYVSEKTAWRLLGRGELAKVKVGSRTLVTPESVDAFIARGGDH